MDDGDILETEDNEEMKRLMEMHGHANSMEINVTDSVKGED